MEDTPDIDISLPPGTPPLPESYREDTSVLAEVAATQFPPNPNPENNSINTPAASEAQTSQPTDMVVVEKLGRIGILERWRLSREVKRQAKEHNRFVDESSAGRGVRVGAGRYTPVDLLGTYMRIAPDQVRGQRIALRRQIKQHNKAIHMFNLQLRKERRRGYIARTTFDRRDALEATTQTIYDVPERVENLVQSAKKRPKLQERIAQQKILQKRHDGQPRVPQDILDRSARARAEREVPSRTQTAAAGGGSGRVPPRGGNIPPTEPPENQNNGVGGDGNNNETTDLNIPSILTSNERIQAVVHDLYDRVYGASETYRRLSLTQGCVLSKQEIDAERHRLFNRFVNSPFYKNIAPEDYMRLRDPDIYSILEYLIMELDKEQFTKYIPHPANKK